MRKRRLSGQKLSHSELMANCENLGERYAQFPAEQAYEIFIGEIQSAINKMYARIKAKSISGVKIEEYERIFVDGYTFLSESIYKFKKDKYKFIDFRAHKGIPYIFDLMCYASENSGGELNEEIITAAITGFNRYLPLKISEICIVHDAVEFAELKYCFNLTEYALEVSKTVDLALNDAKCGNISTAHLRDSVYISTLIKNTDQKHRSEYLSLLSHNDIALEDYESLYYHKLSDLSKGFSNVISTLRNISEQFQGDRLLTLSRTHEYLIETSCEEYIRSDTGSKFYILGLIEKKARKTSELSVAKSIAESPDGLKAFLSKSENKSVFASYIFLQLALSIIISTVLCLTQSMWFIVSGPVLWFLIGRILSDIYAKNISPKKLLSVPSDSIDKTNTLIVSVNLIGSISAAKRAVDHILTVRCGNRGYDCAILIDLPPSKENYFSAEERSIIEYLKKQSAEKNFGIAIRKRIRGGKNVYGGYEKKRGALYMLNEYILTGCTENFYTIDNVKTGYSNVITIDEDNFFACADSLCAILEHPANREKTIISMKSRAYAGEKSQTYYSRLFCDAYGIDQYCESNINFERDAFACNNYTGKGIYRIAEFNACLEERFPDNRILSHDFIEGAFAGVAVSDEVTYESIPQSYSTYLKRRIRWLRGDVQLFPYIFFYNRDKNGIKRKNTLNFAQKQHIFNNIYEGFVPVCNFLMIAIYALTNQIIFLLPVALFLFYPITFGLLFYPIRFRSVSKQFVVGLIQVIVLPAEATMCLYAIILTFIRLIRGKNLLEWMTFANSKSDKEYIKINIIFALTFLIMGIILHRYAMIIFALVFACIFVVELLSRKTQKNVSGIDVAYARSVAKDTWKYYAIQFESGRFLVADNCRVKISNEFTDRTSPTNIGYSLMATLCAYMLGFIDENKFHHITDSVIQEADALQKWRGHLYNWYNTKTKDVLYPNYVSAVDSGNFFLCLYYIREYVSKMSKEKIDEMMQAVDFEALYDTRKKLLRIGYCEKNGMYDSGHYDLMASESLLTYIFCVAYGKLPAECLKALSRKALKNYRCLMSWTGGAFEYLMPWLFINFEKNTILGESLYSVIKLQRQKAVDGLWGVSESQYNAIDDSGNYKYQAFGLKEVALSENVSDEVISPYSSIMTLEYNAYYAENNMKRMMQRGLYGEYGFYEANDGKVIKTFMAHHQGMIILALTNALIPQMKQKFCALPEISSVIYRLSFIPEYSAEAKPVHDHIAIENTSESLYPIEIQRPTVPEINLLSNGKYFLQTFSDSGSSAMWKGNLIYRSNNSEDGFVVKIMIGETRCAFSQSLLYKDSTVLNCSLDGVFCEMKCGVFSDFDGEYRMITVKNASDLSKNVTLEMHLLPVLTEQSAFYSHPEYNYLFVEKYLIDGKIALFNRKSKLCGIVFGGGKAAAEIRGHEVVLTKTIALSPHQREECFFGIVVGYDKQNLMNVCGQITESSEPIQYVSNSLIKNYTPSNDIRMLAQKIKFESLGCNAVLIKNGFDYRNPVVALSIKSDNDLQGLYEKLKSLGNLVGYGIKPDIVVVVYDAGIYYAPLSKQVNQIVSSAKCFRIAEHGVQIHVVDEAAGKKIIKDTTDFYLKNYIDATYVKPLYKISSAQYATESLYKDDAALSLPCGDFLIDGSFVIHSKSMEPKRPFSNIIANKNGGMIITSHGGGFTFGKNAREDKITNFVNDSDADIPVEALAAHENGNTWSLLNDCANSLGERLVKHSFGYSVFTVGYNGIISNVYVTIDEAGRKVYRVELANKTQEKRSIKVYFSVLPALGESFLNNYSALKFTAASNNRIIIENTLNGKIINLLSNAQNNSVEYNREITKKLLQISHKLPLFSTMCDIAPFSACTFNYIIARDCSLIDSKVVVENNYSRFSRLSAVTLSFDSSLMHLAKWLPYQTYCSRFLGRLGYYQVSGAYGFRDQLQDCMTMLYIDSGLVREHILLCAEHQFEAGDVMHWWHSPYFGVRTNIVDDRLFLPYIVCEYIDFTGECEILAERRRFLRDTVIPRGEESVCKEMDVSKTCESLLEHCRRAIFSVCDLISDDGLVYMLGGDWNDAMNKVGVEGRGKSVWASMFLYEVIHKFLKLIADPDDKAKLRKVANRLKEGVARQFNGRYFNRAITDDGTIIGNPESPECKIDLLTQAYCVISDIASQNEKLSAMTEAERILVDHEAKIIKLLDPPFDLMDGIGYISDYPKGIRENGGQYTHAAVWYVMALYKLGEKEKAFKYLNYLNPIEHCKTEESAKRYGAEPYVLSGDVYSCKNKGRAGWSWYTGAASWMYTVIVRYLFGIGINGNIITFQPQLPDQMPSAEADIVLRGRKLHVHIDNSEKSGEWNIIYNSVRYNTNSVNIAKLSNSYSITIKKCP